MSVPRMTSVQSVTVAATGAPVTGGDGSTQCRAVVAALNEDEALLARTVDRLTTDERAALLLAFGRVRDAANLADQGGNVDAALLRAARALYLVEQNREDDGTEEQFPLTVRREYVRRARRVVSAYLNRDQV